MNIRFLTLAEQEVDDAVAWYDQQGIDVSRGFLDDLDRAVRLANTYPLLATQIAPGIRRLLLLRYPYSLIYSIDGNTLVFSPVTTVSSENTNRFNGNDLLDSVGLAPIFTAPKLRNATAWGNAPGNLRQILKR